MQKGVYTNFWCANFWCANFWCACGEIMGIRLQHSKGNIKCYITPSLAFSLSLPPFPSHSLPPSIFPSLLPSPNSLSSTHPSASTTHLWLFCIAVLKEAFSVIPSERQLLSKVGKLPRSPLCQLGIRPHFMVWITLSPASFSSWEVPCVAFFRWEWDPERRTGL